MANQERVFQKALIDELEERFPGCIILKNDPRYLQGIPDLVVMYGNKYALLECKRSETAPHRPNQGWYVQRVNDMGGFARFIFPENKETVLHELESALRIDW